MLSRITVVALALTMSGWDASAQQVQCITARIDLPAGSREISTSEGRRTAQITVPQDNSHREFFLDFAIRDLPSGLVAVTIRSGDVNHPVLEEFESRVGDVVRQTTTQPSFGIALLRIHERVGYACGL